MTEKTTFVLPRTAWAWPAYIAKQAGYYEKYGLAVELKFANHPGGVAMLTSGEAEVNLLPLERAIEVLLKDDSYVVVGSPVRTWLFALMAPARIQHMRQLRGGRIGVAQFGDATHLSAMRLVRTVGLSPTDVNFVVVSADGRVAALTSDRVDATMLSAPAYFELERRGYHSLANLMDYQDLRMPSVLLVKRTAVRENPRLVRALVQAHAEAVERFYRDGAFAVSAYLAYDKQAYDGLMRVHKEYVKQRALDRIPYILANDIVLAISSARSYERHDFRLSIHNRTVDDLLREGFFNQLFGPDIASDEREKIALAYR